MLPRGRRRSARVQIDAGDAALLVVLRLADVVVADDADPNPNRTPNPNPLTRTP